MKFICTNKAPSAIGPYSQAIISNNTLYMSGQLGIDPSTMELETGIKNQAERLLNNIQAIIDEAGFVRENVIKTTIFLKDLSNFSVVNEIYSSYFGSHKPARSTIQVCALPKDALIEVELVAIK